MPSLVLVRPVLLEELKRTYVQTELCFMCASLDTSGCSTVLYILIEITMLVLQLTLNLCFCHSVLGLKSASFRFIYEEARFFQNFSSDK